MCGRFTLRTPMTRLIDHFRAKTQLELKLRYNIAPTQQVAAIRAEGNDKHRQIVTFHWGLIPSWADDPKIGNRMINARGESVAEKPSFRAAFKKRRCLILADGYYEWKKAGTKKQPFHIRMQDGSPFAFAGLWEQWRGTADGPALESCTIITTDASQLTQAVHDRMPVILDSEDYDLWLDPDFSDRETLEKLLIPNETAEMVAEPVSTHVNSPRNDDAACLVPADAGGPDS